MKTTLVAANHLREEIVMAIKYPPTLTFPPLMRSCKPHGVELRVYNSFSFSPQTKIGNILRTFAPSISLRYTESGLSVDLWRCDSHPSAQLRPLACRDGPGHADAMQKRWVLYKIKLFGQATLVIRSVDVARLRSEYQSPGSVSSTSFVSQPANQNLSVRLLDSCRIPPLRRGPPQ